LDDAIRGHGNVLKGLACLPLLHSSLVGVVDADGDPFVWIILIRAGDDRQSGGLVNA